MQMEQLYQEIILDHARSPHHRGLREPFDAEVHHVNPTCGDEVTLRVRLSGDVVADVSYESLGCSISQAAASVMTDLVIGRPLADAMGTFRAFDAMVTSRGADAGDEDVLGDGVAFAGVARYPARVKCALLGWMAFTAALAQAGVGSKRQVAQTAAPADAGTVGPEAPQTTMRDNENRRPAAVQPKG